MKFRGRSTREVHKPAEVKEHLITNFPQCRGIAVAIEYFNKTQNNGHSENCKHFNSLRFDYNLSHLQKNAVYFEKPTIYKLDACVFKV